MAHSRNDFKRPPSSEVELASALNSVRKQLVHALKEVAAAQRKWFAHDHKQREPRHPKRGKPKANK